MSAPRTLKAALHAAAATLPGPTPRLDAEVLLAHALGCTRAALYARSDDALGAAPRQAFAELLARRAQGEPVAYLTGVAEFWSLTLATPGCTLVPRPETELLVEIALRLGPAAAADVLDLGTGSGAIALALAHERPLWRVLGTDADAAALAVARANGARLALANAGFAAGDWFAACGDRRFALIVSNPPYIAAADPCLQGDGLRCEPLHALASGADGLDALRRIVTGAPAHLEPGGWLACEHGAAQGAAVRALFAKAGFTAIATERDLAGLDRVTVGRAGQGGVSDE